MDRLSNFAFSGVDFFLESTESPKIKAGGSSSSNILNRFFNAAAQDLSNLATRTGILATRSARIVNMSNAVAGALQSAFVAVSTRVDAASAYNQILADMHSGFYLDTGSTTATVDYLFGQATLPVTAQTDLITQTDVYGNTYVFSDVELSYSTLTNPDTLDYIVDPDGLEMLAGNQPWLLDPVSGPVWIKLKAPLQDRGLLPNVLEIWPLPAFGFDLYEVSYQLAGASYTSTWYPLDLSYLPNYKSSLGIVQPFGPVRLHLPNQPISQLRIKMVARSANTAWGLFKLKIYNNQYESSATLVVSDPYNRTFTNSLLKGKDPSSLSLLGTTLIGNQCKIAMVSTDSGYTDVITGVILSV